MVTKRHLPRRVGPRTPPLLLVALLGLLPLGACGGGGGGGGGPLAPTNLVYADVAAVYRTDAPVTPNTASTSGGTPALFACVPALPTGLVINPATGTISGVPQAPAPLAPHTVTASNGVGSTQAVITVEVKWTQHKSLEVHSPLTDADIRHLLERTHFGFHQPTYDAIQTDGLATYLGNALSAINAGATVALEADADGLVDDKDFPSLTELALWWLHCIQRTDNPLQEALALHWHDHFACSSDVLGETSTYWYFDHINLWRHGAAGNLRDLVLAMARDWSMLEYLDGRDSTKAIPNENFGREFLELYCHGVNNGYTQADIIAGAALFSGYRRVFDGSRFVIAWTPSQHNDQDQTYLGVFFGGVTNPPSDIYDQAVDVTLAHKAPGETIGYASRWLMRSLLRRFCYDEPAPELIDQLAAMLESGGFELTPVLLTLFQSEAFFSPESKSGFVKSPVEHILGFIRTTGLPVQIQRGDLGDGGRVGLDAILVLLGNRPTQPPVVAGWPEGESWLSAQGMVDRANTIDFVITSRGFQAAEGADPAALLPPGTPTAQDVVEALALRMHISLSPSEVTELVTYLNKDAVGSTTNDPFNATNPTHIDERVRGLLYVLGQHPQYLSR